ncbi:uncharacterized protein BO72DRAFT_523922 [Aspergillus fijiensis CBS 313.89]|uniref:F-box domain-containing protein n=1 Tax=Aspergillus fijiensis CBS 313.89 TaxID=1448319 RepID=A0A8G1W3U0_9EURO|nr:uncharacterized protein BO72DRAFT_523922 [Aspergillus fijiensis CBS 313.89]RAK82053.1 hypothetical protein BO72DRAFT_523922 [Aspergillus fijiensis CBS 313.89]
MDQVLALPELLEPILLALDLRTLLTSAQRVCTQWRSIVQRSSSLQEKLFFKPRATAKRHYSPEPIFNPLLTTAFPAIFHAVSPHRGREFNIADLELITHPAKRTAYLRPEASWRSMLIQQPPTSSFGIVQRSGGQLGYSGSYEIMKTEGGLRMEALFELLFFHHDIDAYNCPDGIIWWSEGAAPKVGRLLEPFAEEEGEKVEQPGVLVHVSFFATCTSTESELEDEDYRDVLNAVRAGYQALKLKPKVLAGPEWERQTWEYSRTWD